MLDKLDDTAAKKLFEQGILENFGKMTHFNAVPGGIVAYPTNGAEIFKWFADNHIKFDFLIINCRTLVTLVVS